MPDLAEPYKSHPELLEPEDYPALNTISAAFAFQAVLVPRKEPRAPEFVFVPLGENRLAEIGALGQWNLAWEWGHFRPEQFRDEMPCRLQWVENHPEANFRFAPLISAGPSAKLAAYGPIHSLVPLPTL